MVEVVPHILDKHSQIAEGAVSQLPPQFSLQKEDAPHGHTTPWKALPQQNPRSASKCTITPVTVASLSYPWPMAKTEDGEGVRNV